MEKMPILITGIERSGSSIIAKIIAASGVFAGDTSKMMENTFLNGFLCSYYRKIGADEKGQFPLPAIEKLQPFQLRDKIECAIMAQGYRWDKPYLLKSNRLSQTWPIWHGAFPDSRWIIVRRRTGDIVYSCLHTAFMQAFRKEEIRKKIGVSDEREGWLWWVHQHEARFVEMIQTGLNCMVVWPERMVDGDYTQIEQMLNWLNLPYDENRIKEMVEPLIWKSRINKSKMK
jgi:hypothetical protein